MEHTYSIEGRHCQSCVSKIEGAIKALPQINNVKVSLNPPAAQIKMETHVSTETLNSAVKKVGDYSLSESNGASLQHAVETKEEDSMLKTYYPLILISVYLVGGVLLRAYGANDYSINSIADNFMGGFFVIFSFFKLLNLKGFAEAYSTYDVVAKRFYNYGFIYPFIELVLGVLYLSGIAPVFTNLTTFIVMGVSSIGVIQSLMKNRQIECACLGTIFKLPMTKITLFEDALMALMAGYMLLHTFA